MSDTESIDYLYDDRKERTKREETIDKPCLHEYDNEIADFQEPAAKKSKIKISKTYKNDSQQRVCDFISSLTDMVPIKQAATKAGIDFKSAYRYRMYYMLHKDVPTINLPGGLRKVDDLTEEHVLFLVNRIDTIVSTSSEATRMQLLKNFPEIKNLHKSRFSRFMKDRCAVAIRKQEKSTVKSNLQETLLKRKEAVESWMLNKDMNFKTNCVFVDEAIFNFPTSKTRCKRTRGWSIKGQPCRKPKAYVTSFNMTMIAAISNNGVINFTKREMQVVPTLDEGRADEKVNHTLAESETRAEYYKRYLEDLMDKLVANGLKEQYIVMENAPIHNNEVIREMIEQRGLKCVFLPPCSSFLNPMEGFWFKLKHDIERTPLEYKGTLMERITESSKDISVGDCQKYIRLSVSSFEPCLTLEENL